MAAQRVTYFKTRIEDRPGSLLGTLKNFKAKNLGLVALWASPGEPGWATLNFIPKNAKKTAEYLRSASFAAEEGTAFLLKGTDNTGVLVKPLDALAQAGVNLVQSYGVAVSGKYGTLLLVGSEDLEKTAKALGAK